MIIRKGLIAVKPEYGRPRLVERDEQGALGRWKDVVIENPKFLVV